MSNIKVLNDVKLWPLNYGIPTKFEYRILCHLASDPEARVYLEPGNNYYAGVSNGNGESGWVTRGTIGSLLSGCHYDRRPWVELDRKASQHPKLRTLKVYKIAEAGYEAIAQHNARQRYEKEHVELARKLLEEERANAQALKPK